MPDYTDSVLLSIKAHLSYEPATGEFTWKRQSGSVRKGSLAGEAKMNRTKTQRYIFIKLKGISLPAHRIAFVFMKGCMPDGEVDHINGDGTDNRWKNLRQASRKENMRNRAVQRNSKTGVSGVCLTKGGKFQVRISRKYIGAYEDFFEAVCVRKSAEKEAGFHFNHGRSPTKQP